MKQKKKVVCAGHICLDITPVFPEGMCAELSSVLAPGKLIQTAGVDIHTGGSVANTGIAMKLLGADVSLMGKVGRDDFGTLILNTLKRYDAQEGMIVSEDAQSSYSVVLAVPGIDRIFLHNPGANDTFSCEDLNFEAVKESVLFHFGYPTLMKRMYADDGAELERMLKAVKECGAAVSMDMSAVSESSEAGKADWPTILKRTLPYVDFFLPSAEELCFMLDKRRYSDWMKRATGRDVTEVVSVKDVRPLGEKALELGARMVLIKCGASGMYYRTSGGSGMKALCGKLELPEKTWLGKEGFEKSFVPNRVVSGTGAGDTSIAAFLCSVLAGEDLADAVQIAAGTGALCVSEYDALGGLKPIGEVKRKIQNGWKRVGQED